MRNLGYAGVAYPEGFLLLLVSCVPALILPAFLVLQAHIRRCPPVRFRTGGNGRRKLIRRGFSGNNITAIRNPHQFAWAYQPPVAPGRLSSIQTLGAVL